MKDRRRRKGVKGRVKPLGNCVFSHTVEVMVLCVLGRSLIKSCLKSARISFPRALLDYQQGWELAALLAM